MSRSAWIEDRAGRGGMRWRARYRSPDARIRSKSFARKPDAQRWLDQQIAALGNSEWVDPQRGKLLFAAWANQVTASRAHLAETTRSRDNTYLRTMVLPHLGNLPLAQIRPSDLRTMVAALSADGKAPATVRKAYQLAALILRHAVSDDLITRSPARGINLPSMRETETEIRFLDHPQVAELHEAIHPRFRVAVSLGAYAGLRLGETTGLRVDNLDLLRRRLTITHSLTNLNGRAELGPTKTKASRRTIPIGQRLCDELAAHLTEYGTGPQGVVMSSPQGSWVRASSWRYRFWHPAVEASIGRPLRYHDLRHTHAAFLIAQGEHPKTIQDRLGHSSIVVTMDTYGHLLPGVAAEVADRLDQAAASATAEAQNEHEVRVLARS